MVIAALLGAVAAAVSLELALPVRRLLDYLSRAALPCALFAIGVTVALRPLRSFGPEFPFIIFCKMILHPVLVLLVLNLMGGIEPLWIGTAVLMAAMPSAASVYVLAAKTDAYVDGASNAILVSTAVSLFTVTFLLYLVDQQLLPSGLF